VAVDVLYQTLDAPVRAHLGAASSAGVDGETLRNLLRLMWELAMGKVWQAFPVPKQRHRAIETD
jgi:hypothetical protein